MYVSLAAALEAEPERARSLRGRIRFGISGGSPPPAPCILALKTLIECPCMGLRFERDFRRWFV